jgi:hypothetical protein
VQLIDSMLTVYRGAFSLRYLQSILLPQQDSMKPVLLKELSAVDSALQYFIFLRSAELSYRNRDLEEAKIQFWNAKNHIPTGALSARIDEKIELCDFVMQELQ